MKIQIWGKSKCFDTKKAERYFKERRIPYQAIDLLRYGMSRGELTSVKNAVGLDTMLNPKAADYALVQHLAYEQDKIERLLEDGAGHIGLFALFLMLCLLFADRIAHPLQTGLNDRARHRKIQAHIAFCVADEERIPALEQNARLVGEEVR